MFHVKHNLPDRAGAVRTNFSDGSNFRKAVFRRFSNKFNRRLPMKKLFFPLILGICVYAQAFAIPVKITSYLIGRKETAGQYERGELNIDNETQSWEIILYKKTGGAEEKILLANSNNFNNGSGVFRSITITENNKSTGSNLFAYIPVFEGGKIQIDFCDNKTERTKRRLVISAL
jgi:hypothetical protein